MADPRRRIYYMNVPATRPPKDESFEEKRIADYLNAYQTTGRPPLPCPPEPTSARERAALNLPPPFEPYSEPLTEAEPLANGAGTEPPRTVDFAAQAFVPWREQEYGSDALYQSIVASDEYKGYSPEELRFEAYRLGKRMADVPLSQPTPRPALLAPPIIAPATYQDSLQSVNSIPPYDQHSFEELRLASLRAGRPLTSSEIIAQNSVLRLTAL